LKINYELHPHDLISRFKLGDALLRQKKAEEALIHLEFFLKHYRAKDALFTEAMRLRDEAVRLRGE